MADFKKGSTFMFSIKSLSCLYMLLGNSDIGLSFYPITIQENKQNQKSDQTEYEGIWSSQ